MPELAIRNPPDESLLPYDGEELVGADARLTIDVSCVEEGTLVAP